jgi:hypothetical protein
MIGKHVSANQRLYTMRRPDGAVIEEIGRADRIPKRLQDEVFSALRDTLCKPFAPDPSIETLDRWGHRARVTFHLAVIEAMERPKRAPRPGSTQVKSTLAAA